MSVSVTPHRQAYTLVELAIVVLLVGIVSAVAAPKYKKALESFRVESAARRVAADLRMARDHAQRSSQSETVDFDAALNSYAMSGMRDINRPASASPYTVNLASTEYPVDLASANFEGVDVVQFDMYGRVTRAGSVVVRSGAKQRTIQVNKAGHVSIL